MPEGFTEMFARRLDESCAVDVKEAQSGDLLIAGRALICPEIATLKFERMPWEIRWCYPMKPARMAQAVSGSCSVGSAEFGSRAVGVTHDRHGR